MKYNFIHLIKNLNPTDFIVILFYIFLTLINLIFSCKIEEWFLLIILNFLLISFVIFIAYKSNNSGKLLFTNLHFYYVIPIIFLTFKQIYIILRALHSIDYDNLLIAIDRFIFGTDPTVFLYKISNPVLTEILQIAYGTFFFLPIILGIEFQIKKKYSQFNFIIFSVVFGFFLSYIGYLFLPAVGPRFTLHNFETINIELPGLFLTNFLREIVNMGESIPSGVSNPIDLVQRDVFPSGHTQMTLIVMYLSVKLKSSNKIFFLITGSLLIFSTVYLRYHYVIDVIAGAIFMIISMYLGLRLYNFWQSKINKPIFNYKDR